MVKYRDEIGWTRIDGLLSSKRAGLIGDSCLELLDRLDDDLRVGDKPHSGTRRLVDVTERVPEVADILDELAPVVEQIIGPGHELAEGTYRCPTPGFGQQLLHADDVPRMVVGPNLCATAIVALVDFTAENGATRVVPRSNRRADLQRLSGKLESHPDEIRLIGPAGTGFVFSGHLLHSGVRNYSSSPRPALQFTFRQPRSSGPQPGVMER